MRQMGRDFESLLEDLKSLKDAEEKAKEIIEKGEEEANKIKSEAEVKASNAISEQKKRMRKTESELRADIEKELEANINKIDTEYAEERGKIKQSSEERMEEAISHVIDEVLKTTIE
jgi:vacuolar-type H+-ATPase subunit E/Vma4